MRGHPQYWNDTITLFNRYDDPDTQKVTWYKHILTDCFFKNGGNKVVIDRAAFENDDVICRIPENEMYMPLTEWMGQNNYIREQYFTLDSKTIITLGAVPDEIGENLESGVRGSEFLKKYKAAGAFTVNQYRENVKVWPKHYFVRGT